MKPPMYAKLVSIWLSIGNAKLRVRNQCSITSGAAVRRSIVTNRRSAATAITKHASVGSELQPHARPWLMPASSDAAPTPRVMEPATSKRTPRSRSVPGSNHSATTKPTKHIGACTAKMARQPTAATSGPPMTTPITGAPALTKLQ